MNTLTKRAYVLLGIIAAFSVGLILLAVSFFLHGGTWATSRANGHLYSGGQITNAGKILDRNGVVLAESVDGKRKYNSGETIRKATLHAVGDPYGYIACGAHTLCRDKLTGYSRIEGIYRLVNDGEGSDVTLTIDANLNATAYKALNGRKGTVGVYNYKTGELVCMVSTPTYDPLNKPADIETNSKYEGAYMNRLLTGLFTPGSTFKLVTSACAIENIPDIFTREFKCDGAYTTATGGKVICNNKHGTLGFGKALTKSCNSTFAAIGVELGKEKLTETVKSMGLCNSYDISGFKTAKGRFDLSEAVEVDLGWAAIGQYTTLMNPLNMMMLAGAAANGGSTPVPYFVQNLLSGTVGSLKTTNILKEETASALRTMMRDNVLNNYGDKKFPNMSFGGKTGTAQVEGEKSHAWFVGASMDESFPYAIVVTVQNGGGGSDVALPIASTVMKALKG
ncbi:MAG TPA: penicillin-binding protein [Ruminococcaceae bacterium]|nr:penicillin-binding protein [Oscillospiraceae bacterium]